MTEIQIDNRMSSLIFIKGPERIEECKIPSNGIAIKCNIVLAVDIFALDKSRFVESRPPYSKFKAANTDRKREGTDQEIRLLFPSIAFKTHYNDST